jgi:hypothetical protein
MSTEVIAAFFTGILGPIILMVLKFYLDKKRRNLDPISESVANSDVIHDELINLLKEVDGDRVWIAQFHNGAYYYPTGKSIRKFTIFYEQTAESVSNISSYFQGVPCSLYSRPLNSILSNKGLRIFDYNATENDAYGLGSLADIGGTRSSAILPLYSFDNKPIGFMSMDWVKKRTNIKDEDWELLNNSAYRIAGYLTNYLETKS